ncbi:hypothetical protein [Nocardia inohanensis]|nr:hypothetical protein [Nocardia inohanensis]
MASILSTGLDLPERARPRGWGGPGARAQRTARHRRGRTGVPARIGVPQM